MTSAPRPTSIRRGAVKTLTALLALCVALGALAAPAAAAPECGCTLVGPYKTPEVKAPVAAELSPGGGKYRLKTTQTATEAQLRIELAANAQLVEVFNLPLARLKFGFSPDGEKFYYQHAFPGEQLDVYGLHHLGNDDSVYSTTVTAGATAGFSPQGRWFHLNVLNGPGQSKVTILDTVSGQVALTKDVYFENVPGYPGDTYGSTGFGYSPEGRTFVFAYRAVGGVIQLNAYNLETRTNVVSRPVGGSSWWRFSPCGDVLAVVSQSDQTSVNVSHYKTASVNQLVGPARTYSPIPAKLELDNTLGDHRILVTSASNVTTATLVGPNTADTACPPAVTLSQVTIAPASVIGGEANATGTVELNAPATTNVTVTLSSNTTAVASVPASVTISAGTTSKSFTVTSKAVTAPTQVQVTATALGTTKTTSITVNPPPPAPAVTVESITVDPGRPTGGSPATGTVVLNGPAPAGGTVVLLSSSASSAASVPASITVPAGQTSRTFPVTTAEVLGDTNATITAKTGDVTKTTRINVLTADRTCTQGSADPATETLRARSFAAYDDAGTNVDCVENKGFTNGITVQPGTSGLAPGTPVDLVVTIRFDGVHRNTPPLGSGGTTADATLSYDIDDDTLAGGEADPNIVDFDANFTQQQYATGVNVIRDTSVTLSTNASTKQEQLDYDEFASADAAVMEADTGTLTATYRTTVGAHLSIDADISTVASAYGSGAAAVAAFDNTFKATTKPAPGFEKLQLVYDVGDQPVNQAPSCAPVVVSGAEDTAITGSVSCTDLEGAPLTYTVVSGPAHGALSAIAADGSFTYTPAANYAGADSFTVKANDGSLDSPVVAVDLTVTPVNDLPVCTDSKGVTKAGSAVPGKVTCTDVDGDTLTFTVAEAPSNGTVSAINADGSFTYTPAAGFSGTDNLTVAAADGRGGIATATYTVTVTSVIIGPPTSIDDCKNDGWKKYNAPVFGNQGGCVSYVARRK